MAEIGSLSVEFTRLAQLTGEPKYYDAIARITDALEKHQDNTSLPGMWPTYLDASGCLGPAPVVSSESYNDDKLVVSAPVKVGGLPTNTSDAVPAEASDDDFDPKKMVPLELPKPIEFVSVEDDTSEEAPLKKEKKEKRQLDEPAPTAFEMAPRTFGLPAATSIVPLPVCDEVGLGQVSGSRAERYTMGGMSDSTYEYLPKVSLST